MTLQETFLRLNGDQELLGLEPMDEVPHGADIMTISPPLNQTRNSYSQDPELGFGRLARLFNVHDKDYRKPNFLIAHGYHRHTVWG